jgi:tetratricopeptide (TPR) repeat protein
MSDRPAARVSALAATALIVCCTGAAGQVPQTFTNLQVLPKDIPRAELVATMRGFAGALGVRCTHCHVGPDNLEGMDFASDDKEKKRAARVMLRMVRAINADYLAKLPDADGREQVGCITCHRAAARPPKPLEEILHATVVARGATAGLEEYEKYRGEFYGSGLYDFRERTLNVVGTRLREQKRGADAKTVFEKNLERYPKSPVALTNLGQIAAESGDKAAALAYFTRALEVDPKNEFVRGLLDKLK